ncbi:MAG: amidohydrolase [Phycisphaerae bacterium]|nr:MAG: amidohydrolase [Phycisphaerae bacterium]
MNPDFAASVQSRLSELIAFRHDLHAHPETSFEETRTSSKVLERLRDMPGLTIRDGLAGGTGICATINAEKPGPCVLLRADMDALPIDEMSELPYKSEHPGKMHACGHDGHTTALLGAAYALTDHADALAGPVKLCFQPAEEQGCGGQRMIDDGVLEDPHVDAAFALHGWPDLEVGHILSVPGAILAATSPFEIEFTGRGGHAAYPHKGTDLLVAVAQLVTNAQAIRTRLIDPINPIVISFTQIHGGFTHNVLPETCHVKGTIRALDSKAHATAKQQLQHFVQSTAATFSIQADLRFIEDYPVLINDAGCAALVAEVAADTFGAEKVTTRSNPSMGGEDFAFYAQHVPSAMFRLGLRPKGALEYPNLHNPHFNFNDDAIATGAIMHSTIAHRYQRTRAD